MGGAATGDEAVEVSVKAIPPLANGLGGGGKHAGRGLDAVGPGVEDHLETEVLGLAGLPHDGIVGVRAHGDLLVLRGTQGLSFMCPSALSLLVQFPKRPGQFLGRPHPPCRDHRKGGTMSGALPNSGAEVA